MKMIFHAHANKTLLHKKCCVLNLILKVRVFGTLKWPTSFVFFLLSNKNEYLHGLLKLHFSKLLK